MEDLLTADSQVAGIVLAHHLAVHSRRFVKLFFVLYNKKGLEERPFLFVSYLSFYNCNNFLTYKSQFLKFLVKNADRLHEIEKF